MCFLPSAQHMHIIQSQFLFVPTLRSTQQSKSWNWMGYWLTTNNNARCQNWLKQVISQVHRSNLQLARFFLCGVVGVGEGLAGRYISLRKIKEKKSKVLFGLVNKWQDRSSMTTEYDGKWFDIDLFSDASLFLPSLWAAMLKARLSTLLGIGFLSTLLWRVKMRNYFVPLLEWCSEEGMESTWKNGEERGYISQDA